MTIRRQVIPLQPRARQSVRIFRKIDRYLRNPGAGRFHHKGLAAAFGAHREQRRDGVALGLRLDDPVDVLA